MGLVRSPDRSAATVKLASHRTVALGSWGRDSHRSRMTQTPSATAEHGLAIKRQSTALISLPTEEGQHRAVMWQRHSDKWTVRGWIYIVIMLTVVVRQVHLEITPEGGFTAFNHCPFYPINYVQVGTHQECLSAMSITKHIYSFSFQYHVNSVYKSNLYLKLYLILY